MRAVVFASRMTDVLELTDVEEPTAEIPGAPSFVATDLRDSKDVDVDVEIFLVLKPRLFPSGLFGG